MKKITSVMMLALLIVTAQLSALFTSCSGQFIDPNFLELYDDNDFFGKWDHDDDDDWDDDFPWWLF